MQAITAKKKPRRAGGDYRPFCQRRSDRLVVRATRSLCADIQASAPAAVAKLVTIVGSVSGTATSTPNLSPA